MDSGSSIRIPPGATLSTSPKEVAKGTQARQGEISGSHRRDRITDKEESSRSSSATKRKLHQPDVPSTKRRRIVETNHQPERIKPIHHPTPLQDGGDQSNEGLDPKERLDGQTRPEGRVLVSPNIPPTPQLPQFSVAEEDLGVQESPIWTAECPTCLHKAPETSGSTIEEAGDKMHPISGRHVDHGPVQTGFAVTPSNGNRIADTARIYHQHQKECLQAHSEDRISGIPDRLHPDVYVSTKAQGRGYQEECSESLQRREGDPNETDSKPSGTDGCCAPSSFTSSNLLQSPSTRKDQSSSAKGIQLNNPTDTTGQRGVELVAQVPGETQRQQPADHPVGPDDRNGCLYPGLGSKLSGNQQGRPLDETGKGKPHQLPGTTSSVPGSESVRSEGEPEVYPTQDGQCNSDLLCEQDGRYPLVSNVESGSRGMEMVHCKIDQNTCRASTRERECTGRLAITSLWRLQRLEAGQGSVHQAERSDGTIYHRSLRLQNEQAVASVLQLEARSIRIYSGCTINPMDQSIPVPLSTVYTDQQMHRKDQAGESRSSDDCTRLAEPSMVSKTPGGSDRRTHPPPDDPGHLAEHARRGPPTGDQGPPPSSRMAHIR